MPSTPSMVGWASGPPVAPPSTGLFRTASTMRLRASWSSDGMARDRRSSIASKSRSSSEPWPAFLSNCPPSGLPAALWLLPFASIAMIPASLSVSGRLCAAFRRGG